MNTVCLLGSPRRGGNSDTLAQRFMDQASDLGASVERFALVDLEFNGCVNLLQCKSGGTRCGQNDDLTPVLDAIARSEVLVLASPVYFTSVTGQMKLAIDRLFSFFVPEYPVAEIKSRLSPDRHLVFVQTQGEPESRYADLLDSFAAGFTALGFSQQHLIRAWGVRESGDVGDNEAFLTQCERVAKAIYTARV